MNGAVPFAWRERRVRAGGADVAVYEAGATDAAPAALLLHGLGHWADAAWRPLVPYLDGARRYVAFDLPGFGASDKPDVRYDAAYFRSVAAGVADALGIERFAVVGHSLGGFVAADFAATSGERITHLALIAPAGFTRVPRHVAASVLALALGPWFVRRTPSRGFVRRMVERAVFDRAAIDASVLDRAYALAGDDGVRRAFAGVYAASTDLFTGRRALHARFARYTGPVLCAWGRHDRYIPVRALAAVRRVYPQATVLVLERSAHLPAVEEPRALASALDAFLRA